MPFLNYFAAFSTSKDGPIRKQLAPSIFPRCCSPTTLKPPLCRLRYFLYAHVTRSILQRFWETVKHV